MKGSVASTAPMLCALLIIASLPVAGAAKDRLKVPSDGFSFFFDSFDDGRTKPYRVTFTTSGFKSVYKFNDGGSVTNIKADDETYTIAYNDNGELDTVERSSGRRNLAQTKEEEGGVDMKTFHRNSPPPPQKRHSYACEDCELENADRSSEQRNLAEGDEGGGIGMQTTARKIPSPPEKRHLYACEVCELEKADRTSDWRNHAQKDVEGSVDNMRSHPRKNPPPGARVYGRGHTSTAMHDDSDHTTTNKRRLYDCEDCELTWDTACNKGLETVCNLEGFGNPLLSSAVASIGVFCEKLGDICSERTASDVCGDGGCEEEEEVECLPPLTITLEWTGASGLSTREQPALDLYVIEPGGQTAMQRASEPAFGVLTGNTYTMLSGLDADTATGTYIAFGEWWEGFAPISWTLTATDGSGRVGKTEEGQFTGDCGSTITSSSTFSNSDQGTSRGTTKLVYVELFEYVDNGCES